MLGSARQRGFNMIEVAVTMAILGVLMAAVLPSVSEYIRNTHVRSIAESAQNGLQRARAEALRRNKVVTFWLVSPSTAAPLDNSCAVSSASASWVISLDDPTGKCDIAPSLTVAPRTVEAYGAGQGANGITIAGLASDGTTAASSVSFNGYGQALQTGQPLSRIDVSHSNTGARRLRIQISTSGGVRMCDRDVTGSDPRVCS
ncbi:MAG: type 4 pilin N-terminal cleavage/methylation protein [Ramlibacter sp.]|nr:type 4 pilin N-terminal cleavage/methylation protein [Ramlibacter sp.]